MASKTNQLSLRTPESRRQPYTHADRLGAYRRMSGKPGLDTQTETLNDLDIPWNIVVWDDPVNLMRYVVYVLQKVFGYNRSLATKLMLEVHTQGKSLVATEDREQAELHLHQLHSYGLQATLRRAE
jgi:ATP-dependent Clp protease adaptor protein ClpS